MRALRPRKLLWLAYLAAFVPAISADMLLRVNRVSQDHVVLSVEEVTPRYTAIVLGCRVNGDDPSRCLEERLRKALDLYQAGRVQRLLLSGDHGTKGYDEVNTMRQWLVGNGVPVDHIFLDHAGFDTYDSMVRAQAVFQVEDAVIVSQAFHLPRAVYLARAVGLNAVGCVADPPAGSACAGSAIREPLACAKAVLNVVTSASPKFLGPIIPITGSPQATFYRPLE